MSGHRRPFIVIGKNIQPRGALLRGGARVASLPGGRPVPPFSVDTGAERLLSAADANLLTGREAFGMEFLTAYRAGELA